MENTGTQNEATPIDPNGTQSQTAEGTIPSARGTDGRFLQAPDSTKGAVAQAAAEAKRRLKIDDQEIDEDEVIKVYKDRKGHQRAANAALQEGLKARKQTEEFISMMKDKGKLTTALEKLGYKKEDLRRISEEYLAAALSEEMMDPREKELNKYKSELEKYRDLEKKQSEMIEQRRNEELKAKYAGDFEKQFVDALKTTGIPPTKRMVGEMAKYIHQAAKMKFEMTPVEAAKLVREDMESAYRNLFGEAEADTLVKLVGENGLQKIRAYDTARLKNPNENLKTPKEQGELNRKRDNSKRMTPQEWRAFNRK